MAQLNTAPGSITPAQKKAIVLHFVRLGKNVHAARAYCGVHERLGELSRADASHMITRLTGKGLPNPPGQKPKRRKSQEGVTRMIAAEQIEQIDRLLNQCFPERGAGSLWLIRTFKVKRVQDLATAQRGGEVIRVLKMISKRAAPVRKRSVSAASNSCNRVGRTNDRTT